MVVKWFISPAQVLPLPSKREEPGCEGSLLSYPVLCLPLFNALGCNSTRVCGASSRPGWNAQKACARATHTDHRERESKKERERRCAATIHCPCCGYMSVVDQPPPGRRNTCFGKFNVIFSIPNYLQNNILAMVGSQVLMQITEHSALFMNIQAHAWNRQRRAWSMSQGCEHCQTSPHSWRASGHIDHVLRSGLVHVLAAVLTFISAAGPPHKLKGDLSKTPHVTLALLAKLDLPNCPPLQCSSGLATTKVTPNLFRSQPFILPPPPWLLLSVISEGVGSCRAFLCPSESCHCWEKESIPLL